MKSRATLSSGRKLVSAAMLVSALSAAIFARPQNQQQHVPATMTNSIGMKLVLIPAGEFMMGAEEEMAETLRVLPFCNPELLPRERPRHKVRITNPFYMGAYEVTLGQFRM